MKLLGTLMTPLMYYKNEQLTILMRLSGHPYNITKVLKERTPLHTNETIRVP